MVLELEPHKPCVPIPCAGHLSPPPPVICAIGVEWEQKATGWRVSSLSSFCYYFPLAFCPVSHSSFISSSWKWWLIPVTVANSNFQFSSTPRAYSFLLSLFPLKDAGDTSDSHSLKSGQGRLVIVMGPGPCGFVGSFFHTKF